MMIDITLKFISNLEAITATDDATDATETIVFDDKPDRKSNDDDDSEFYLYKGPSSPFALRKFPKDIYNNNTTANDSQPPNFSDDKPTRELDATTTTTASIIFDEKPK